MSIEQQLRAIHELTRGDLYNAEFDGGTWMVEAVETRETIEDFVAASAGWRECGRMIRGTFAGLPCAAWRQVQVKKGAPRRALAVIDFGDLRYAVDHPLGDWLIAR